MTGGRMQGTLIRGIGSFYTVRDAAGNEYILRCMKKIRRTGKSPMAGDEVLFTPGDGDDDGWIEEILPRKTECLRPPVANVTRLVVVIAPEPEPDMVLTDRQIARAVAQGMSVAIAVNKSDLDADMAEEIRKQYAAAQIPVYAVSARTGDGLGALKEAMRGELCCLSGQSGAGKSTLMNALLGITLETGDLSAKIRRGRNTTRQAELYEKDGIRVMDTAGFNLMEPERGLEPGKLKERYPEFRKYEGKCRFRECLHDKEPGCAVTEAAEAGAVSAERVQRYRVLLGEIREAWRTRYD